MLKFLTVVGLIVVLVAGLLVATAWLALRRLRRSRLVAVGTRAVADGRLALTVLDPRSTARRGAALLALRISGQHRLLRQRVAAAQRTGAYLGDVPALLPRLEAEGRRLQAAAGQASGLPAATRELQAQCDHHLATLVDLTEAVGAATKAPAADEGLAQQAAEVVLALRLHRAAYAELMGNDIDRHARLPLADAS